MKPTYQINKSKPIGNKTPRAVATAFPPLKSKNIGYICPKQAASAIMPKFSGSKPKKYAPQTGMVPLRISKTNTSAAIYLLLIRNTLVAPGLFDPIERGSGSFNSLHNKIALEIEPTK